MKSSISSYMIFVKEPKVPEEESKQAKFLSEYQDIFIEDMPNELPPSRGEDDHSIDLVPGSSPPNKPPYRVSWAQQEEIRRQVQELVG